MSTSESTSQELPAPRPGKPSPSGLTRGLEWISRLLLWCLAPVVALALLLGGAVALVTFHPPDLTPYVETLATFLSEKSGFAVRLASLDLTTGLSLAVVGQGVEIDDPVNGAPILSAERILLRVSPLALARGGLPVAITLEQPKATLRRDAAGKLYLGGLPLAGEAGAPARDHAWVLLNAVDLHGAEWIWIDETIRDAGRPLRLVAADITLSAFLERAGQGRVNGSARLASFGEGGRLEFSGERFRDGRWSARVALHQGLVAPLKPYLSDAEPLNGLTAPIDATVEMTGQDRDLLKADWRAELGAGELAWPALFRWPLPITRLTAHGGLDHEAGGWRVDVQGFALRSAHGQAQGSVLVSGIGGPGSPFMDLKAEASGNPASKAGFYYPTPIMAPSLVQWLDNAIKEGQVKRASAHIKGHLANMPAGPNDPPEDRFHIEADVTGATLHYFPPLVPLTQATTHLIFDRYSFTARVSEATYGETRKVKGEVRIANMVDNPVVEIAADSPQLDLGSIWQEIVTHPKLRWDEAVGMGGAKATGQGSGSIKLSLPLENLATLSYSGQVEMKQTQFHPRFLDHPLTEATGTLSIDSERLDIRLESGQFGEFPLSGEAAARHYREPGKTAFTARVKTRVEAEHLAEWLAPLLGEEGGIRGRAPLEIGFVRQPGGAGFAVQGTANLKEIAARGRMGWSKVAGEEGEIRGEGVLDGDGRLKLTDFRVNAGNLGGAGRLDWDLAGNLGEVAFGELRLDKSFGKVKLTRARGKGGVGWSIDAAWKQLDMGPLWSQPGGTGDPRAAAGDAERIDPKRSWPRVAMKLRADHLLLANGERASQLDTEVEIELRILRIAAFSMLQSGGEVSGNGEFLWSNRIGSGGYSGRLLMHGSDFGRLFKSLDLNEGLEGGSGQMEVSLDGFKPPGQRWIDTLSGTARFKFQDGKVRRLGFVATLLGLFSLKDLPKLVLGARPDLDVTGLHYREFQGDFAIRESVWVIDGMRLLSPSMNMVVTGRIDFPGDTVDLLVGMRPLQTLDSLVNTVPLLGKLVTGDRQAVLETQFDVTGSTHAPQATIRPVSSLAPGLLRDWITAPIDWIKRVTGKSKSSAAPERGAKEP
ncbi:MAG: AsmA-like C-terminal domain-containing protein [Magnetococcales bacterium]|nr:AsmA-like C-terminal domain-containing protein [Magnetococcales bacterium]